MTLTEEQREAIRVISKLPMAIGCQLCHPYIMKNYGSHFIVLRDMIDSSGTVEPTGGFDLEKARAGISHYRIENPSNVDTECALKELVDQANLAEDAIAEIERLRAALAESEKVVEHKGKSATKPRSWQITGDRIAAIDQGLRFLEWSNARNGNVETKKRIATLKTMLKEANDEHGFER